MKEKVFRVLSMVMNVPLEQINEDSSPDTIEAWDSLKHMNLILALEEEFKIEFSDEEIINLTDMRLILSAVKDKISV